MKRSLHRSFAYACAFGTTALAVLPRTASAQDLAPPPPMDPSATTAPAMTPPPSTPVTETTQTLDASEREDSGRGLEFFYVNGGVSFSTVGLETLNSDKLAVAKTTGAGPEFDLGLGVRLLIFTLGPRVRYHALSNFNLWQINGEAAFHLPISRWDTYFGLHGGYSFVGTLSQDAFASATSNVSASDVRVRGFDAGLQLGLDYYLSPWFSLGAEIAGDVLFLRRAAVSNSTDPDFGSSGGGAGLGAIMGIHTGLHL